MSVTVIVAASHLHIDGPDELLNLEVFVDAANEWVAAKVADTTPESVSLLATLLLLEHWWERSQRGPASITSGDESYADIGGRSYAIPGEVRELLDGFLAVTESAPPQGSFPDAVDWPDSVEYWPA